MVPAAYVRLDALPLTPNGKIDRNALPEPDDAALPMQAFEPPQGMMEESVAQVWQELLGAGRVGRHDHFFDLGGHSLLATQFAVRMRTRLGIEVPVGCIFQAPILHAVARLLDDELARQCDAHDVDEIQAEMDGMSAEELQAWIDEQDALERSGQVPS
jgi:hypothetical protein